MKIIQIDWQTGEIKERGVLSKEGSNENWIAVYKKINKEIAHLGLVWLIGVE